MDYKDLLKDINPTARRWIRTLIGYSLAALVGGFGMALQEVILPELKVLVGAEIYKLLYGIILGSLVATIAALSKKLRDERDVYLPF